MPSNNPFDDDEPFDDDKQICEDGYNNFTFNNIYEYLNSRKELDIIYKGKDYVGTITGTITGTNINLEEIPKTITVEEVNEREDVVGIHNFNIKDCCFKIRPSYIDQNIWISGGKQKTKRKQYKKSKSKKSKSKKNKKKTTTKNKCGKRFPKN